MDYFAGLDVSVNETSVCIADDTGKIVREAKVASEPEALRAALMIVAKLWGAAKEHRNTRLHTRAETNRQGRAASLRDKS